LVFIGLFYRDFIMPIFYVARKNGERGLRKMNAKDKTIKQNCKSYPCRFPCSCEYFKKNGFTACLTYDFAEIVCGDACIYAAWHFSMRGAYFYCQLKGMSRGRLKRRQSNCPDAKFDKRLFEMRKRFEEVNKK
jgi:hypothetical protein